MTPAANQPSGQGNHGQLEPTPQSRVRRLAAWVAGHELWLLAGVAPLLLFPGRWSLPAFPVIVLLWLCRWVARGRLTVATPADVPNACMLLMTVVGLYASVDRPSSLAGLWRILLGVAVFYGMVNALRAEAQLRRLPPALILGSFGLALVALVGTEWEVVRLFPQLQFYRLLPRLLRDLQDQNAFHPRIMGMALATWFPLPLALLLFAPDKRHRAWAGIAALAMGLPLLLTQSLQAAVGLACALLFLAACWNRRFLLSLPLGLGLLLVGLGWYGPQRATLVALSLDNPLGIAAALRLDMWSRALAMIHDLPYTGIGLDAFPVIQSQFYPGVMIGPEPHAHNLFLQIALDLGIPGLFAFLWLLLGLGHAAFRAYCGCTDALLRALLLGAVGGVVSYLASGWLDTIWTAKPSVLLWVLLGLVAVLSAAVVSSQEPRLSRRRLTSLRAVAPWIVLLLLLLPGLWVTGGGPRANWAVLRAHKILWSVDANNPPSAAPLSSLAEDLRTAVRADTDNPHLLSLLGRVLAWLGQYPAAIEAFGERVRLDGENATARYDPSESLRRRIAGEQAEDRWGDAVRIYRHWTTRYPQRAEAYLLIALVRSQHHDDAQGAAAVLNAAIERGAEPGGLLQHGLEQLGELAPTGG